MYQNDILKAVEILVEETRKGDLDLKDFVPLLKAFIDSPLFVILEKLLESRPVLRIALAILKGYINNL